MLSKLGVELTNNAFHDIQRCIIKSLLAVQKLVTNSPNSFELYGFDFIFDSEGKAWLLEVNGGPSMTANTKEDLDLKVGVVDDVMTIVNIEGMYCDVNVD
jgi:tubulin polyglutamylase TTLL9